MNNKNASEQINIIENITIQILKGVVKEMKEQRKRTKYSKLAKNIRKDLLRLWDVCDNWEAIHWGDEDDLEI